MKYLRISAVPVRRDTNPLNAPAAAMAARLCGKNEAVELRLHRKGGETLCYMGFDSLTRMKQAVTALSTNGYLCCEENPSSAPLTTVLLHRAVERRPVTRPGAPPEQMLLPTPVVADSFRAEAVFQALSCLEDGCGLAFFFRRASALPLNTVSHIQRLAPAEGSVSYELLHSTELYEAVGCVYGAGEALAILTSEAVYGFPGLAALTIPPAPVGCGLFDRLDANDTAAPPLRPLSRTYLKRELDVVANLSPSAGLYGLPLNKDTIFGTPYPRQKESAQCIRLGFSATGNPMEIPLKTLRKHLFMGGAPGSGKGNELFTLITQLHEEGIPMLIIESAKEEMHHLRKVIPDLQVWQPKAGEYIMNPFALEGDITCGEMRTSLLQTLRLCFKLDGPLEELFSSTLNRCFAKSGYSDDSTAFSPGVTPFGLSEFMEEYVRLLDEKGYSERTKNDLRTAGVVRLNTLFNQNHAVFDTINSIPIPELLGGKNLIQLNCLPTPEAKQMFASMLLISIGAWLRLRGGHCVDKPVKLAILLDESHNLLQPVEDSQGRVYSFARDFSNMLLELRSQGVAIILADQSSDNIPSEITDVCATKIFFGASPSSGIGSNRAFLNCDDTALQHVYLLGPGEACFITSGMPAAAYFTCPNIIDRFHLEQSYPRENRYLKRHPRLTLETFRECAACSARGKCSHADKTVARQRASVLFQQYGHLLWGLMAQKKTKEVDKQISGLLVQILTDIHRKESNPNCRHCALVQFVREFNREHPGVLDLNNMQKNAKKIWTAMDAKKRSEGSGY